MAGIRDPEKTYLGPRIKKAPRIPDPDPQHCIQSRTISRAETQQLASYAQPLEDKFQKRSTAITLRRTIPRTGAHPSQDYSHFPEQEYSHRRTMPRTGAQPLQDYSQNRSTTNSGPFPEQEHCYLGTTSISGAQSLQEHSHWWTNSIAGA
jgi:hypothetical protein